MTPRGGRDAILGVRDGIIHLRVAAAPVDGAANKACATLLAEALGVRPSQVELVGGAASRNKRFSVPGLSQSDVDARLSALPALPE